jgi:hypothetical protein
MIFWHGLGTRKNLTRTQMVHKMGKEIFFAGAAAAGLWKYEEDMHGCCSIAQVSSIVSSYIILFPEGTSLENMLQHNLKF